jgi:hypothetical protein
MACNTDKEYEELQHQQVWQCDKPKITGSIVLYVIFWHLEFLFVFATITTTKIKQKQKTSTKQLNAFPCIVLIIF